MKRPMVRLALAWIGFILICRTLGWTLRPVSEAEALLRARADGDGAQTGLYGTLGGRLESIQINSSGSWFLRMTETVFVPLDAPEQALPAGRVLVYFPARGDPAVGNRAEIRGTLTLLQTADNPGEFDAAAYYEAENIACCLEGDAMRITDTGTDRVAEAARQLRLRLGSGLRQAFESRDAGLLGAMLLGERSGVDEESEALFELAGLSHLFSVSGLHVSFWAGVLSWFSGLLLSFLPLGRGRFWRGGFAFLRALISCAGIVFYMILCGGKTPISRAGLMLLAYQASLAGRFSYVLPSDLALAALAALIPAPYALFQASFQLSYGCILILGCLLPVLNRRLYLETPGGQAALVPVLLQTGTMPVMLWHSFCFHPYSFFANLIAVPFAAFILGGGFLAAVLTPWLRPAGLIAAGGVHYLLEGIRLLCRLVRLLPLHTVVLGRPAAWQLTVYTGLVLFGIGLSVRSRKSEMRRLDELIEAAGAGPIRRVIREARRSALLLLLWLMATVCVFLYRDGGRLKLTSLYVGQGDCHVLTLPDGSRYLMDAGSSSRKAGTKSVVPYLRFEGIRTLDSILVSHPDSDHINALTAVLQADGLKVRSLIIPAAFFGSEKCAELLAAAEAASVPVRYVGAGDSWEDGGVRFQVLYPPVRQQAESNDGSLILMLSWQDFDALFTGDLGEAGERVLMKRYGEALQTTDYLKVAHHGSRYSSCEPFLAAVTPSLSVISCGRNNPYGHPTKETLDRLAQVGSTVCRTDRDGAVTVWVAADGTTEVQTFRQTEIELFKEEPMKQKEENKESGLSTWLVCGLLIGIGVLGLCLALFLPNPERESLPENAVANSLPAVSGSAGSGTASLPEKTEYPFPSLAETEGTWPVTAPASAESEENTVSLPAEKTEANAGRIGPQEDPRAPGYVLDQAFTDRLYALFAGDLTNNTNEADPFRGLSATFKRELDELAENFAQGRADAETTREAIRGRSFRWPNDALALEHTAADFSVRLYIYPAVDAEVLRERILLSNVQGRHYLFLRIYRSADGSELRIYMINGAIK